MKPVVLVPVNRLQSAKGRLGGLLSGAQRAELALTTLTTVLEAVGAWGSHAVVLSADQDVLSRVRPPHRAEPESEGIAGLNPQLEAALERMQPSRVLILHADLPLAGAEALETLYAAAAPPPSAALVEPADGGTNAMLLQPPRRFALCYGKDSAALHRSAAEAAGMAVVTVEIEDLALDLDTPDDIAVLLGTEKGRTSAAGRLLRSFGIAERERF